MESYKPLFKILKFKHVFLIPLLIAIFLTACFDKNNASETLETKRSPSFNNEHLKILSIWSGQFENILFNGLVEPNEINNIPHSPIRILMGSREWNDEDTAVATVFIDISEISPANIDRLVVRFSLGGPDSSDAFPVGEGSIEKLDGTTAIARIYTKTLAERPKAVDYRVVAWIDYNNDKKLISDDSETPILSTHFFSVVSHSNYEAAYEALTPPSNLTNSRAATFLHAFLNNTVIHYRYSENFVEVSEIYESSGNIIFSDIDSELENALNYYVGVRFDSNEKPLVRNFQIGEDSLLSRDVRDSLTMKQLIIAELERNRQVVLSNHPDTQTFNLSLPKGISYTDKSTNGVDIELHSIYNNADLVNAKVQFSTRCDNGKLKLDSLSITGSILDLYDFDYGEKLTPGNLAAMIQAGYGSLTSRTYGSGGQVFRHETKLDGEITSIDYEFGVCAIVQEFSMTGSWQGTYNWDCGNGKNGSSNLVFEIIDSDGKLSGTAKYLGGESDLYGDRVIDVTWDIWDFKGGVASKNGNMIVISVPDTDAFVNNRFSGELINNTLSGITQNGDTPVLGTDGCSAPFTNSGTFEVQME